MTKALSTLGEQIEYFNSLAEREYHSDTMRALSPLEQQHLDDWRTHFCPIVQNMTPGEIAMSNRNFDDLNDTLDDLIDANAAAPLAHQKAAEAPVGFVEKCPACHGSGTFTSWSGRPLGECFKCKGKGQRTYKTSYADRAKARQSREARADRQQAENVEAFKATHPEVHAYLTADAARGNDFALSMLQGIAKYGSLTEKQMAAVQRGMERKAAFEAEKAQREADAPTVDISRIEAAMNTAIENGLKYPRLSLGDFKMTLATSRSKTPGAIFVKDSESGEYLGKVMGGKFLAVRATTQEQVAKVIEVCADPSAAAVAYGKRTGVCACCSRELTNSESIERGIGPICASKYGF